MVVEVVLLKILLVLIKATLVLIETVKYQNHSGDPNFILTTILSLEGSAN